MENSTDNTSDGIRRRSVLKSGVIGGVLGAAGTGVAAIVVTSDPPRGSQGNQMTYVGIENVAGPAPQGLPQIPIEIDSDGYLKGIWPAGNGADGRPSMRIGNVTYSSRWFDYCDLLTAPGFRSDSGQDNYFRAPHGTTYDWQEDRSAGDKLHVDDFGDYYEWTNGIGQSGLGKPAMTTWRSVDVPSPDQIPVQVLRSTRIQGLYDEDHPLSKWIKRTTQDGFIAWLSRCTNRCCIPLFKRFPGSASHGGENLVYCQCYGSMYDPFTLTTEPLPSGQQTDS